MWQGIGEAEQHDKELVEVFMFNVIQMHLDLVVLRAKILRTMCGSRTGGWPLPCVMSD
jgi:hypothetical protein